MAHFAVKTLRDEHYCQARMLNSGQTARVKDTKKNPNQNPQHIFLLRCHYIFRWQKDRK